MLYLNKGEIIVCPPPREWGLQHKKAREMWTHSIKYSNFKWLNQLLLKQITVKVVPLRTYIAWFVYCVIAAAYDSDIYFCLNILSPNPISYLICKSLLLLTHTFNLSTTENNTRCLTRLHKRVIYRQQQQQQHKHDHQYHSHQSFSIIILITCHS